MSTPPASWGDCLLRAPLGYLMVRLCTWGVFLKSILLRLKCAFKPPGNLLWKGPRGPLSSIVLKWGQSPWPEFQRQGLGFN
jgi:hypothetical protein